jgi:hypothetical protein
MGAVLDVPPRGLLLVKVAMLGAVAAVFLLAYADLRREQARALEDFTAEQASLARSYAEAMRTRLDNVLRDLSLVGAAVAGRNDPLLRSLLAGEPAYREVDVLDPSGKAILELPSADASVSSSPTLKQALFDLLSRGASEGVAISGPLARNAETGRERLRFFVLRRPTDTVVMLVDLDRLFSGVRAAAGAPGSIMRWIVLDDARRWVAFGSPDRPDEAAWRSDTGPALDQVTALLSSMAVGSEGTATLSREAADSLGLGRRLAVAGYAPVPIAVGRPWSVAVVTSARRVRDRARFAAWRLAAATGLAALIVGLFGVVVARQQRGAQRLSNALQLAEATAALRERSEKMIEAIPIGVLALDRARCVTSANPYLTDRGVRAAGTLRECLPIASVDERAQLEALVMEACERRVPVSRDGLSVRLGKDERRDIDAYAIPLGRPLPDVDCFLVLHDRTEMRAL